jgi:uncharacterized integral membrane protein
MQIFLFVALFIAALAAVFALQNSTPVQISFLTWNFDSSLAIVLLTALAAGALMSFFVSMPGNVRARWVIRQQRKKMAEMETSLTDAKARLEDANARAELLESKLTMLPVVENPANATNAAPKEATPSKPKVYGLFPRPGDDED